MAKAASSDELRQGFEKHLEQTRGHVQRLEKIFQALGESPKGKTCKGMQGLIEEGSEATEEDYEDGVMDAALIGAAQRVEHYEIAGYGTVHSMAETLGEDDHVSLLEETLEEEKETDKKLTELAHSLARTGYFTFAYTASASLKNGDAAVSASERQHESQKLQNQGRKFPACQTSRNSQRRIIRSQAGRTTLPKGQLRDAILSYHDLLFLFSP